MIKKHDVKMIIRNALEELDRKISEIKNVDGPSVYEAHVDEDENGNLIFSFKENCLSNTADIYKISIEYIWFEVKIWIN